MTLPPAYGGGGAGGGDLLADGSVPLTADWDIGGFDLTNLGDLGGATGLQLRMTAAGVRIETGISGDPAYLFQIASASDTLSLTIDDTKGHLGLGMAPHASYTISAETRAVNGMQVLSLGSSFNAYVFEGGTSGLCGFIMDGANSGSMCLRNGGTLVHSLTGSGVSFLCDGFGTTLAVGTDTASEGTLQVTQISTVATIPVLRLEQLDKDQAFVRLVGESHASDASQSLVDAANMTTPGAIIGWEKVYIEDTQASGPITNGFAYRPLHAVPTA